MDLAIEANRNSALFNTMQQVLDVYNPLLHKARPTVVNQTIHNIRVSPTRWANTLDTWNGTQSVRFDIPRIGSLTDFNVKCAFRIPGVSATAITAPGTGDRGFATPGLKLGQITENGNVITNNARGRLDRLYADDLLGFNMIRSYTVSSKSRRIFSATGEYLLVRFSQMDNDMKNTIAKAITPVSMFEGSVDDMFYSPGTTYNVQIPLFMFFNEHISNSLDVNFSEEVHIDIELRPPSELFYYGQIADLSQVNDFAQDLKKGLPHIQGYTGAGVLEGAGKISWDQAVHDTPNDTVDVVGMVELPIADAYIGIMQDWGRRHIQGIGQPLEKPGDSYGVLKDRTSGPTFAYPDVDSEGQSVQIQFEGQARFVVQDTDAYRALRQQMFPEGTGLTTITYDTSQEVFQNVFAGAGGSTLLDASRGGNFTDPDLSQTGITVGNSSYFIDLPLRTNNLALSTSFMVRKHSDMGGSGNTQAGANSAVPLIGPDALGNVLGAHRIYTRCIPVHYFMVMAAGRIVYESDASTQMNLTQSGMYNGTGADWGKKFSVENRELVDSSVSSNKPFDVYTINYGLQASRLENSGSLSLQNLNNPTLRIYFKPETWAEYSNIVPDAEGVTKSNATVAAEMGVQVDVIHEFFNVTTINSGNGEITSGLNQ